MVRRRWKRSDLDGLPGNGVQVIVAEVQLLQRQQVVEGPLVDHHQLVVVQNQVVELRHAAEGVVAYPGQAVAAHRSEEEEEELIHPAGGGSGGNKGVPVEVQSSEVFQIGEGVRGDEGDGVPGQRQVHQPSHVCKVLPLHAEECLQKRLDHLRRHRPPNTSSLRTRRGDVSKQALLMDVELRGIHTCTLRSEHKQAAPAAPPAEP